MSKKASGRTALLGILAYLAAMLCLVGLLLAGVELCLRIVDYGKPTTLFVRKKSETGDVYVSNRNYSRICFPPKFVRWPVECSFPVEKPQGVKRVFVAGESAAMGDPDYTFGFWRILDVILAKQYPEAQFEIINVSITAINSNIVLPIVRECTKYDPDLFIIYAGNNEVIGPYGPSTVFTPFLKSQTGIRISLFIKSLRLWQWAWSAGESWFGENRHTRDWTGMAMFMEHELYFRDPELKRVHRRFRANVMDMCRAAQRGGAQVLLCTVGGNVRDCPPFLSIPQKGLSQAEVSTIDKAIDAAVGVMDSAIGDARYASLLNARAVDPGYAEVDYLIGLYNLARGNDSVALREFHSARDKDGLRVRTDSRQNAALYSVASSKRLKATHLVDIEHVLDSAAGPGGAGNGFFWEHVHLTFAGNYVIACELADQVAYRFGLEAFGSRPSLEECRDALAFTAFEEFEVTRDMLHRLKVAPFTSQIGNKGRVEQLAASVARLDSIVENTYDDQKQTYIDAITARPNDPYIHKNYGQFLLSEGSMDEIREFVKEDSRRKGR